MVFRKFIKCRIDHFHIGAFDGLLDIRYLLRAFVDQKNKKMHLRFCLLHGERHFLEQCGFSSLRRRHDHSSLSFSDRGNKVHNPHRRGASRSFQADSLIREDRCKILEILSLHGL